MSIDQIVLGVLFANSICICNFCPVMCGVCEDRWKISQIEVENVHLSSPEKLVISSNSSHSITSRFLLTIILDLTIQVKYIVNG